MSKNHFIPSNTFSQPSAQNLSPITRKQIGLKALAKVAPISLLAKKHLTSRKFIYVQKGKAEQALVREFVGEDEDPSTLFTLPVTRQWLHQVVLFLALNCHSSYQGVVELFRDLLDLKICKGSVHNILYQALDAAKESNRNQDLSQVRIGAHDEIFQGRKPVLVGCDAQSTYC